MIYPTTQERLGWTDEITKAFEVDSEKALPNLRDYWESDITWEFPFIPPTDKSKADKTGVFKHYKKQLSQHGRREEDQRSLQQFPVYPESISPYGRQRWVGYIVYIIKMCPPSNPFMLTFSLKAEPSEARGERREPSLTQSPLSNTNFSMETLFRTIPLGACPDRLKSDFCNRRSKPGSAFAASPDLVELVGTEEL